MNKKFLIGSIIAVVLIIGGGVGYYFYNQASADTVFDQNFCAGTTGGGWKNCTQNMSSLRRYMSLQSNGHFRNILNGWASTSFNLNPTSPITNPPTSNPPTGSMTPTAIPTSEPVVTPSNPTVTPTPPTNPTPSPMMPTDPTLNPTASAQGGPVVVTAYQKSGYQGFNIRLAVGNYNTKNLASGVPGDSLSNDTMSSIKITPGYTVHLYQDAFWSGAELTLTADESDLHHENFDNTVSSMVVEKTGTYNNVASAYQKSGYGGFWIPLMVGDYNTDDLVALGLSNDTMSSVRVTPGYSVILYSNGDYSGASLTLTKDETDLSHENFDNIVSSLKVVKN